MAFLLLRRVTQTAQTKAVMSISKFGAMSGTDAPKPPTTIGVQFKNMAMEV